MSPLRLNGSTSGNVSLDAPAVAGNNTLVLPTGNGSADQALVTNGSGSLSWSDRGRMTLATAQNSTSGTSIDFTGIPSWAKRVTVMLNGVSTNGTASPILQLGTSSGLVTTGYLYHAAYTGSSTGTINTTIGFSAGTGSPGVAIYGAWTLFLITGNTWVDQTVFGISDGGPAYYGSIGGGRIALSGVLDRVRLTTSNGTDTFDAGSINIMYEG